MNLGAAPGQPDRRHFLSRLQFRTRAKKSGGKGALPSFSWLCGGVTFWLKHQFPLPFPPCPQNVSPLIYPGKTLPGLLERLWGVWVPSKQPQALVPGAPAYSCGRARGKVSGDAGIGCSLQTHHPPFQFSSTYHPYPGYPKGPSISAEQASCPGPFHTPHSWEIPSGDRERSQALVDVLVSSPPAPSSLALGNRPSLTSLLRILVMLSHSGD